LPEPDHDGTTATKLKRQFVFVVLVVFEYVT